MQYHQFRRRMYGLSGLGAVDGSSYHNLMAWFERKQMDGWCELYPHLGELDRAARRYQSALSQYQVVANNLGVQTLDPDLAEYAAELAEQCEDAIRKSRQLKDVLYAVKDSVLGADQGREGSTYEDYCRNKRAKGITQMVREAEDMGLGRPPGLGALPAIVGAVVAGITIVGVLYMIKDLVEGSRIHEEHQESFRVNTSLCNKGDEAACARAKIQTQGMVEADLARISKRDLPEALADTAKWLVIGALGIGGLLAWRRYQQAKGSASPPAVERPLLPAPPGV
jgi:hypothetical protein